MGKEVAGSRPAVAPSTLTAQRFRNPFRHHAHAEANSPWFERGVNIAGNAKLCAVGAVTISGAPSSGDEPVQRPRLAALLIRWGSTASLGEILLEAGLIEFCHALRAVDVRPRPARTLEHGADGGVANRQHRDILAGFEASELVLVALHDGGHLRDVRLALGDIALQLCDHRPLGVDRLLEHVAHRRGLSDVARSDVDLV